MDDVCRETGAAVRDPLILHRRRFVIMAGAYGAATGAVVAQQPAAAWPFEQQFGHFVLHADFPLDEQKLPVRRELKRLDQDIRQLLRLPEGSGEIHVVLMHSESAYRQYLQAYFPTLPYRRALFLRDRGPGMLFTFRHDQVLDDVRHETTHAILNDDRPPLPLWIDEGLAEYFEPTAAERYRGNPYLPIVQRELEAGAITSIERLAEIVDLSNFADAHYRHSWAWVHFMLHRSPESRMLLARYVESYYRDSAFRLERALESLFADLEQQLKKHFAALKSPSTK